MYVWASADREGQRWFLYPSAYPDPGIDSPSYTEDKDSPFQQESLQILSAAEVGASPFLLPFLLQALQTGLCAIHKERSHFSEFSFVCKIWSGKKYKLPITVKTHAVINDQTDKQIPCWKFSEVWDLVYSVFHRGKGSTSENSCLCKQPSHTTSSVGSGYSLKGGQGAVVCVM